MIVGGYRAKLDFLSFRRARKLDFACQVKADPKDHEEVLQGVYRAGHEYVEDKPLGSA